MNSQSAQHRRPHGRRIAGAFACALALSACVSAHAAQHLINPGDDWASKVDKIRPGDEIVLMPGRHRAASFDRLVGTAGAPITIRGASPAKPSIIAAQLDGIRIKEAAHIVIRDLQIVGGAASGIWIAAAQGSEDVTSSTPPPMPDEPITAVKPKSVRASDIYIDNVAISKVGPRGQRHGIYLCGFTDARLNAIHIEGWGGSAIELVACEDVVITRGVFRGLRDHSQYCGIRARAGCDRVSISDSTFESAGDIAICMGGKSNPEEFIPPIQDDAPAKSIVEAARINIEQCRIVGSLCSVAFIHATDCVVRSSTIFRPQRCVIALLTQSPDARMKAAARNIIGNNLIVWQPGDVKRLVEIDDGLDAAAIVLEPNLWWSGESEEQRKKLGPLPGNAGQQEEQVLTVNPKLSETLKPANGEARGFGAGV